MKDFIKLLIVPALAGAMLVGCATPSTTTLLKDMEYNNPYAAQSVPELKIQRGDRLNIKVMSENPVLSAPFSDGVSATSAGASELGYPVDNNGQIEFPVLGRLKVEGLTLRQCEQLVAQGIKESGYIKEPIVKASMGNFRITIIGSSGNNVMNVKEDNINLLQVLASNGGVDGKMQKIKDVMVIRTEGGQHTAYTVNLQSKDLFDSPVFYLKQNDIVYLKPRGRSLNPTGEAIMTFVQSGLQLGWIFSNLAFWYYRK